MHMASNTHLQEGQKIIKFIFAEDIKYIHISICTKSKLSGY